MEKTECREWEWSDQRNISRSFVYEEKTICLGRARMDGLHLSSLFLYCLTRGIFSLQSFCSSQGLFPHILWC